MCMASNDDIGVFLACEEPEGCRGMFVTVDDDHAEALVFDRKNRWKTLLQDWLVAVSVDGRQGCTPVVASACFGERLVDAFGREITGMDHVIGFTDCGQCSPVESVVVHTVGVAQNGEHAGLSMARGTAVSVPVQLYRSLEHEQVMAGNSKGVVIAALIANGAIAILKFIGFTLTGSPAMLSETYHSISDTGNQVFLLIGISYSSRDADRRHPFGYGKAQFFYSFLVSVLLFGIAGWESAKHGYEKLVHPNAHSVAEQPELLGVTFPAVYVNYGVLIGAIAFESYALYKANRELKRQIEVHNWSGYREAFRKTSDVTTLTAFTEDTIAASGAGIALLGVYLTQVTHDPVFDAAAALLIGLMLMGFAVALAWENKRLLLGESLPQEDEQQLHEIVESHDHVSEIVDFRTVFFGPGRLLVAADVAFEPGIETAEMDDLITAIEDELMAAEPFVKKVYIEPEDDR